MQIFPIPAPLPLTIRRLSCNEAHGEVVLQLQSLMREYLENDRFILQMAHTAFTCMNHHVFVAERGTTIIGSATLQLKELLSGHLAFVDDIIVTKRERGKGVAKALIDHIQKYTYLELGVDILELNSNPDRSDLQQLFMRTGFRKHSSDYFVLDLKRKYDTVSYLEAAE